MSKKKNRTGIIEEPDARVAGRPPRLSIESEETYRNFMEDAPIGICIADMSGHVQYINRKIEEVTGWTREELLSRDGMNAGFFDEETKRILRERLAARLKGDVERNTEVSVIRRDGSRLWVNLKMTILYKDGLPGGLQIVFIDMTERKQVEEALLESEKRYRELVDFLPIAIYEMDLKGNIISGNPESSRIFGYGQEDLQKGINAFQALSGPREIERAIENGMMILSGKRTGGTEYTGIRKDGSTFPLLSVAGPILREGKPVGLRGAIIDLSKQKEAERDLQDIRDQLIQSEKLASIGRISAGVAHEILNPVNIIFLELQFMKNMENLPPVFLEEIEVCMTQIHRIVTIAENLKQVSRMSANKMVMTDVNVLISDVLTLYSTQLNIDGIEIEAQYQADLPEILLDKEKMEQVFVNLISNAAAAMAGKEKKVLRVATRGNGNTDSLTIVVADTGTGIGEEDMPKIFEPFFTTRRHEKGTGLGLPISYGIVQGHGGKIWAENNEWGGASFMIELPVKTTAT